MAEATVAGWDLGGAHLKVARVEGGRHIARALQLPCALWQGLEELERALDAAVEQLGPVERHAVTMTGELVDLFASRAQGVQSLIAAMTARFPEAELRIYGGRAGFLTAAAAQEQPLDVASANWLASAALAAARLSEGLLIDVGSTTTDVVPFAGGRVLAEGLSDAARLASGELIYRGVTRTPVMAVAAEVSFEGVRQGLMAEHFATMADVYRLTGALPEDADQHATADGRDKTVEASARRLARMLGRDLEEAGLAAWRRLAVSLATSQQASLAVAILRAVGRSGLGDRAPLIGAGIGRFVARDVAAATGRPYVDFADLVEGDAEAREWAARCAPAAAVALLAAEAW